MRLLRRSLGVAGGAVSAVLLAVSLWHAAGQSTSPFPARVPYLQNMRPDRVTVVWVTPDRGAGEIEYSADQSFSRRIPAQMAEIPASVTEAGIPYYRYQGELTGLQPGEQYSYRALLDGQDLNPSADLRFRVPPPGPFTFLVFGDSGDGSQQQAQLAQMMLQREDPALVLHVGDVAYPVGSFSQFRGNHFAVYTALMRRVPFYPSPGNHDYDTAGAAPYLSFHAPPSEGVPPGDRGRYYSFDWGDYHFVSLDTNTPFRDAVRGEGAMLRWLDEDLARTRRLWRIVYFHHPARPTSNHENDPTSFLVRQHLEPLFDKHDVQLVFSGHEHNYQQGAPRRGGQFVGPGAGTVNIITGGGGAELYSVSPREGLIYAESARHYVRGEALGPRLTLQAIRADGQEIDRLTLTPSPWLGEGGVVNAANFTASVAPGGLVTIFGHQLASGDTAATRLPLPFELGGATVTVGGRPLPLLYASRSQINAQLPYDVQGSMMLRVTTPGGAAEIPLVVSEPAPVIFAFSGGAAAATHANGSAVSPASPAQGGEFISLYLTGLGRPNGEIAAGVPAPSTPLLLARGPVEVQIGNLTLAPSFAGLAPGFAGLYQVNVQIPRELQTSTYGLRVVVRGISSNTVTLAVRQ